MEIKLTSVYISDLDKALKFYTEVLNFVKKQDIDLGGGNRFVTVVSPDDLDGTELLLEPNGEIDYVKNFKESIYNSGLPFTIFFTKDIYGEYERMLKLGARFTSEPTEQFGAIMTTFDDTCGNLIRLYQVK